MHLKKRQLILIVAITAFLRVAAPADQTEQADPWLWLEEVDGTNALAWVNGQNLRAAQELKSKPEFDSLYQDALETLDSASRIPSVTQRGKWLYNLWQDAGHPRGIYRRTTLDEFRKPDPDWETVLDVDALSKKEGKPWVFQGMDCLYPEYRQCLVSLAPGGTDANEIREFDADKLAFVQDGFFVPTSKSSASWIDSDTLFLGPDTGKNSVTESGFPRAVKIWKRGQALENARSIYECDAKSVSATGYRIRTDRGNIDLVNEDLTTWNNLYFQYLNGALQKLNLPETSVIEGGWSGRLVISLKDDWSFRGKNFVADSVVIADPAALRDGKGAIDLIAAPSKTEAISTVNITRSGMLIQMLDNARGRLYRYYPQAGAWKRQAIPFPDNGAIHVSSVDEESGNSFIEFESFTIPPALYHVREGNPDPQLLKEQKAAFDGSQMDVQQWWTTSRDGTKVPYFIVMKKSTPLDGTNPTHIFSYGGFRIPLTPSYSGSYEDLHGCYGKLWLERGGVFVLANIRGGGEFGEAWHRGALRENRPRAYEDFEAIAQDLIARKVTSPKHLAIEGRSNGGLLVTALMVRHPELYGAIICGSPLVDLLRYHKLLAGASWMEELGNPDQPQDRKFLETYSPYQLMKSAQNYPPVFFYASTRDDRVHPGHARKAVAKMIELGYTDTLYYENTEGGHHASSTNEQLAYRLALAYTHLWERIGKK